MIMPGPCWQSRTAREREVLRDPRFGKRGRPPADWMQQQPRQSPTTAASLPAVVGYCLELPAGDDGICLPWVQAREPMIRVLQDPAPANQTLARLSPDPV